MIKYIVDGNYDDIDKMPYDFQENFALIGGSKWKGLISPRFQSEIVDRFKSELSHYINKVRDDRYNMTYNLQNAFMGDKLFDNEDEISILQKALLLEIKYYDYETGRSSHSLRIQTDILQNTEGADPKTFPQLILDRILLGVKLISDPAIAEYMDTPFGELAKFSRITTASDEATLKAFMLLKYHAKESYKFEPEYFKDHRHTIWKEVLDCGARYFLVRHYTSH